MSTKQEKIESIRHAVDVAKRRRESLVRRREILGPHWPRNELFELEMTEDCIARGEKIMKENE